MWLWIGSAASCSSEPAWVVRRIRRVMDRNGTFPTRWTAIGHRYYTEADALQFLGEGDAAPKGLTVVYCRVSRRGQQADLER
ncbi:MAG: hypothetical protein OXH72_06305 [Caldilineaceae bacterium]|nr:hypothetical protein [Caldilineaceae bacterium]